MAKYTVEVEELSVSVHTLEATTEDDAREAAIEWHRDTDPTVRDFSTRILGVGDSE